MFKILWLEKLMYNAYSGHIQLSGGVNFTLDSDSQCTLTCISTGGPATTVTWTRYSTTVTEGTETVLDDSVTLAKSDPFLRSALQQLQIEIDINSTFVLDANTEVWELN